MRLINGILPDIGIIIHGIHGIVNGKIYTHKNRKRSVLCMRNTVKTIIDYYVGAYGPTLRIDVQMFDWLLFFRNYIIQLIEDKINYIDFINFQNIDVTNIYSFTLYKTHKSIYPSIYKSNDKKNNLIFKWYLTSDQLFHITGLIDKLLEDENSGHQYLTNEEEGLLIELAYKE